ncbi:2-amino-4-hydroxy-6-hydroxymethyldihydropteridine pyrophosphokinase [Corynebacterium phocae]|uniref:2-amino-4-hydroxy-6-hydroxymethyldihydropteridine diphosphokinase n=1 Tax=Corynebacterium phocae TaxID=161895 RepID=A0A1L7D588_9CORY|nr:2-amino-4-hydroxy-6-hydroxymethyldihydropteridine diphosphokinase [Corynebacterium phocae]APT93280.1 2-amino-4-hydroxy-6-hydroxymethyldihydropteridine pyrophosphokinase [Corynebacterium phocae]KAA8721608.1 2-amino-4-hydroxy-6-hydroxymethyldihydropteridine diphosphokinase [Corynebacterium phocae]
MRAVLSVGSNMDDRVELLRTVFRDFAGEIVSQSAVYSTPPWGVEDQDEFLNAVLVVDVNDTPLQLLARGQELENQAQRARLRRWGPRTLDVDIVDIEGFSSESAELTVPHPYAHQRAFVLIPWLEAHPAATLHGKELGALIADLDPAEVAGVRRLGMMEEL